MENYQELGVRPPWT